MKNVFKKIAVFVLAVVMGTGVFAGCKKPGKGEYTYNDYTTGSPQTWNPHALQYNDESYVLQYTYMPFYSAVPRPDGEGGALAEYDYVPEMASAKWTDVTQSLTDEQKATYGIGEDETLRAIQIPINPDAKWSNGDRITAKDYVESYKRLLDPDMQNRQASTYVSGDATFVNAKAYFAPGRDVLSYLDSDAFNGAVTGAVDYEPNYFSISRTNPVFGQSLKEDLDNDEFADYYVFDEVNLLAKWLEEEDDYGMIAVTDANRAELEADFKNIITAFYDNSAAAPYWKVFGFYWDGESMLDATFDEVGIFASADETKLTYVFESARTNDYDVYSSIPSSAYLVHTATYDAGYTTVGGLKTTTYGTDVSKFMSYGPYMMTSSQPDKLFVFEKNPNWYGWTDGKHVNQYQTTRINLHIVKENETALQMFLAGQLDNYNPSGAAIDDFKNSQYFQAMSDYALWRINFNTQLSQLSTIQTTEAANQDVKNIQVLSDIKFRQAFSLAMDRATYVLQTPAYLPAYAAVPPDSYDNFEDPTSEYRTSLPAMLAVLDVYGITSYNGVAIDRSNAAQVKTAYQAITGFDLDKAKTLLGELYNNLPAGVTKEANGKVVVKFRICASTNTAPLSEAALRYEAQIKTFLAALSQGTNFEIDIKFTTSADRYGDLKSGKIEAMYGAVGSGGTEYIALRMFIDHNYSNYVENKLDNSKPITINIDGTDITKSIYEWYTAATAANGEYLNADLSVRIKIAAALETAVLKEYTFVPMCYSTFTIVDSLKSSDPIKGSGHIIAGTGGMRLKTYHMDDYEWAQFLKKNRNDLSSIYKSSGN